MPRNPKYAANSICTKMSIVKKDLTLDIGFRHIFQNMSLFKKYVFKIVVEL